MRARLARAGLDCILQAIHWWLVIVAALILGGAI